MLNVGAHLPVEAMAAAEARAETGEDRARKKRWRVTTKPLKPFDFENRRKPRSIMQVRWWAWNKSLGEGRHSAAWPIVAHTLELPVGDACGRRWDEREQC